MKSAGSRFSSRAALLALALCLAGCVSTQDIESIQAQLAELQRQVLLLQSQSPNKNEMATLSAQVAKQGESLLKTEADMQLRMDQLSQQLETLQARLEDTNGRLGNLSQQIAATNQELKSFREAQRQLLEAQQPAAAGPGGDSPAAGVPGPGPQPPQVGADPKALYEAAHSDYVRGSYELAIRQFQEYLDEFPNTDLSDNAAYWIGECYYRQRKFQQAVVAFDLVLERYSGSDKVPSAQLKKGYSFLELGQRAQGIKELQQVIRQYSKSDEARLAAQRLKEIGVDAR